MRRYVYSDDTFADSSITTLSVNICLLYRVATLWGVATLLFVTPQGCYVQCSIFKCRTSGIIPRNVLLHAFNSFTQNAVMHFFKTLPFFFVTLAWLFSSEKQKLTTGTYFEWWIPTCMYVGSEEILRGLTCTLWRSWATVFRLFCWKR